MRVYAREPYERTDLPKEYDTYECWFCGKELTEGEVVDIPYSALKSGKVNGCQECKDEREKE